MTREVIRAGILVASALLLAACSSGGSGGSDAPPVETTTTDAQPQQFGAMKAAEIMQALSNKSFKYSRGARTGVITFSSDGTFVYQEDGKGEGSGVWQASEGELCEAFDPTNFLPKGTRSECHPFRWTGDAYHAGGARFQPV
jgi:hypothetical protein